MTDLRYPASVSENIVRAPMTIEERIEAGRSAYLASQEPQVTCFPSSGQIEAILRAAYPELHTVPPTAWLAPWEASEEMAISALDHRHKDREGVPPAAVAAAYFAAMRQAHLHPEKSP